MASAAVSSSWATTAGSLPVPGFFAQQNDTMATLADGSILVAGGEDGRRNPLGLSARFTPADGHWTPTSGQLNTARRLHTVTRLADGRVLVTGGVPGPVAVPAKGTNSVEIFSPGNGGSWASVAPMNEPRFSHSATLLDGGKVLVAGGCSTRSADTNRALRSAEIYDPAADKWTTVTAPMTDVRFGHAAVLLPNKKVLVAGGLITIGRGQYAALGYCEIYDPATGPDTGKWSVTGGLTAARKGHRITLLNDGSVLATGGDIPAFESQWTIQPYSLSSCERFVLDPATGVGRWVAEAAMPWGLSDHRAVLLPQSGKVLVIGGTDSGVFDAGYPDVLLFDPGAAPGAGKWTTTASMATGRWATAAIALPGDKVLVAGGVYRSGAAAPVIGENLLTATAEGYTP
jgi:hypothetical protein